MLNEAKRNVLLVSWDVYGSSRVVEVPVHLRELQHVHDLVEQDVVQVDTSVVALSFGAKEPEGDANFGAGRRRLRDEDCRLKQKKG